MNLQANRKSIKRVWPIVRYGQLSDIDAHIDHDYTRGPDKRNRIIATGEYVRNLTEARQIVAKMLELEVVVPSTEVDVLIDAVRGKYNT